MYSLFSAYLTHRSTCSLCISNLSAKDVLCPTMVEWCNRAMWFCINHDREGKGYGFFPGILYLQISVFQQKFNFVNLLMWEELIMTYT